MHFSRFIVLILGLCFAFLCEAKTLVISDIDDTLKQSHVLNLREMVLNARRTDNPFLAMNGAILALKFGEPDIKVFYLSNAIEQIMRGLHTRFLQFNSFPPGGLFLRKSPFDSNFKINSLRQIFAEEKPTKAILLGDNGERDAEIYNQIKNEFPDIEIHTFVHLVYSVNNQSERGAKLFNDQVGYATAFDLVMAFFRKGFINDQITARFFQAYATAFLNESSVSPVGAIAIPVWMDCRDLFWSQPIDPLKEIFFVEVAKKIHQRCEKRELL